MRYIAIFLLLQFPIFVFGQAKKVLTNHLENYGQDLWSEIGTLKIEGKHVTQNYEAFPLAIFIKENQKISVEGISKEAGYTFKMNGENFWSTNHSENEIQENLEALILAHALTIGSPLAKYQDELNYFGYEIFEGETYHTFRRTEENYNITYLLDKDNNELRYLICKIDQDQQMSALLSFDKYKSHHGLKMPTAIAINISDDYREWVFDEIFLGIAIKDQIFQPRNSQ